MLALLTADCSPGDTEIAVAEAPTILAFHANWCKVCDRMEPVWTTLERKGYKVVHIDVDRSTQDEHYAVDIVPTTICLIAGREVGREIGVASAAEIERHLRQ